VLVGWCDLCVSVLGCWCVGVLVCWCVGVLLCWCVGVLVCWGVGVLECWWVGALVCCYVGVLVITKYIQQNQTIKRTGNVWLDHPDMTQSGCIEKRRAFRHIYTARFEEAEGRAKNVYDLRHFLGDGLETCLRLNVYGYNTAMEDLSVKIRAADEARKESLLPHFNYKDYLTLYPDLRPHLLDFKSGYAHYKKNGFYEGRIPRTLTPDESEKFSVQTYLELNRDYSHSIVVPSQEEYKDAVKHYLSSPNRKYTWEFLHPEG
jgi:hypothetical protein